MYLKRTEIILSKNASKDLTINAKKYLEKQVGKLTLGKFLWSIRESQEYSLEEFARLLKISRSHLCDIEKHRKFVSPQRAYDFAKRLGYSPRQFIRLALQDIINNCGLHYMVLLKAT